MKATKKKEFQPIKEDFEEYLDGLEVKNTGMIMTASEEIVEDLEKINNRSEKEERKLKFFDGLKKYILTKEIKKFLKD